MKLPLLTTAQAAPARKLYFVNAPVDFFCIGAASLILYALLWAFQREPNSTLLTATIILSILCNWPHFAATNYRLYHSRENMRQYPMTAYVVPIALAFMVWLAFTWPASAAPILVQLYVFWSPYHYSGQSTGISMLYAKRSGIILGLTEIWALKGFIYGTFLTSFALRASKPGIGTFYGIPFPSLNLPAWVPVALHVLMWICGGVFALLIAKWCWQNKRIIPPIILLPAIAQYFWFVKAMDLNSFLEFVPFFHGMQYLLIAWAMQLKEKMNENEIAPTKAFVRSESLRWMAINIAGGAFLFWVLPKFFGAHEMAFGTAAAVIVSAVQIHHFFVDGVIWRLRNPKVGQSLLVNVDDMARAPA